MMPVRALRCLASLLLCSLAACSVACSAPSAAAGAGTEAAAATVSAASQAPAPDRAHTLALARATGGHPVDKEIDLLQRRLENLPRKADLWVQLGRAWVKKARRVQAAAGSARSPVVGAQLLNTDF